MDQQNVSLTKDSNVVVLVHEEKKKSRRRDGLRIRCITCLFILLIVAVLMGVVIVATLAHNKNFWITNHNETHTNYSMTVAIPEGSIKTENSQQSNNPDQEFNNPDLEYKNSDLESNNPDPDTNNLDPESNNPDPESNNPDIESNNQDPESSNPDPETATEISKQPPHVTSMHDGNSVSVQSSTKLTASSETPALAVTSLTQSIPTTTNTHSTTRKRFTFPLFTTIMDNNTPSPMTTAPLAVEDEEVDADPGDTDRNNECVEIIRPSCRDLLPYSLTTKRSNEVGALGEHGLVDEYFFDSTKHDCHDGWMFFLCGHVFQQCVPDAPAGWQPPCLCPDFHDEVYEECRWYNIQPDFPDGIESYHFICNGTTDADKCIRP